MAQDAIDDEDLKLEAPKAGLAFRAEMWLMDAFLGYWPYLLTVVGTALFLVFAYGQYASWTRSTQRSISREIARIEDRLPLPTAVVALGALSGEIGASEDLVAAAGRFEAVEGSGPGRVEALLRAGELYRVAGKPEEARRALSAASALASGDLKALVEGALATVEIDAGDTDGAASRLQALAEGSHGVFSQQAALDLGTLYEHLDRKADAAAVYDRFLARWPDSPRAGEVRSRKGAVGAGG